MRKKVVVLGNTAKHLLTFRGPFLFALADAGHEVIAIAPAEDAAVRAAFERGNVRFETLALDRTSMNPVRDVLTIARLAARLRRHRADVYFGYTIKPVLYGPIAAALAGVPQRCVMVSGLGYAFLGQDRFARRILAQFVEGLYRVALARCDLVFFQNPNDLDEFRERGLLPVHARTVVVNGSGVDLDEFSEQPMPGGPPIVLYTGRLLRDKGIYELVDAARIVRARQPQVRVQLLGYLDNNPASIDCAQIERWTREGIIEYLGEAADVRPYLARATVFVCPSHREGTPRSVLEALAVGRPVVVTDVPGCRETVIDGDNGVLVPAHDPAGLARGILRVLADPEALTRMAVRSRALAESKYDARLVSRSMVEAMGLG